MLLPAALSTTNRTSGSAAWGYALMTGIGFSAPIALLMAVAQLAVPGLYIGAATALSASARSVGGAVGLSIFQAILNSKMTDAVPKYVAQGAFKGGLAMSQANTVLPTLIPAVASGDAQVIAGLSSIPGITPQIIDDAIIGFQDALAHSLRVRFSNTIRRETCLRKLRSVCLDRLCGICGRWNGFRGGLEAVDRSYEWAH